MFLKSQNKRTVDCFFFFVIFISFVTIHAQTTATLDANGPGDTYELINSVFGSGAASEVPDNYPTCNEVHVRHIREDWDSTLNKYAFLFDVYVDSLIDYDRCSNTDRQRIEIKTV